MLYCICTCTCDSLLTYMYFVFVGVHPQFYNVRPSMKPDSTSSEGTESKVGIDPDACQIVLKCPGMEGNGYEFFYQSLIILMSCGSEYRLYSEDLLSRLIVSYKMNCLSVCLSACFHPHIYPL